MIFEAKDLGPTQAKLTEWLCTKLPAAEHLRIDDLRVPSAGLSNETLLCVVRYREAGCEHELDLVFRAQPTGHPLFPDYDLGLQWRILELLGPTAVRVPPLRWNEPEATVLGSPFYVMERIDGMIPPDVPPYHAAGCMAEASAADRATMWWKGLEQLAEIHRLDPAELDLSFLEKPRFEGDTLDQELAYWQNFLDFAAGGNEQPTTSAALEWLREHRPASKRRRLCWGDARLPNLIFRNDEVVGVLDWEMAFLGDPTADLAWWLFLDWHHSEGYGIPRLEGFPSREETIERYEQLVGWKCEDLEYWEVFAAMRFAVIMARVAAVMESVGTPMPSPDFQINNAPTRWLARTLDLPPPGDSGDEGVTDIAESVLHVQFNLTGEGGYQWYLVADRGTGTRADGTVANPTVTVTADVGDWHAIQSGELDRAQAFLGGKLQIDGDISVMMQLEAMISAVAMAGPGATYTTNEEQEVEASDRELTAEDDQRHSPGPDAMPLWNESFWFPMYDPESEIGVVFRVGSYTKLERANLYLGITHRGELVHSVVHDELPLPPMKSDRLELAAGLSIEWLKPLECFRLRYALGSYGFDLLWEASAPPYKYPPPPGTTPDQVPRHIEHPGQVSGEVTIAGKAHRMKGWGHRDHSFGGERDWDKFWRWVYLSGRVGDDCWFNIVEIRFGPDFPPIHIGCVSDGGEVAALTKVEVSVETDESGTEPLSVEARVVDELGREHHIVSEAVLAVVPAQFRKTWLKDGLTRFRRGDDVGHGIFEHGYQEQ